MDFARPLQLVAPTLDGDVLAVLARADIEITGRQIFRLAKHGSEAGIRRAAERLVEQGIVLRRRAGRSYLYRLNRHHLAAPFVEGLATLPEQLVDRLRELVAGWDLRPAIAVLFGSVADRHASAGSDLDVLIVRPRGCDASSPLWRDQLSELERTATDWTGNDARVLEYGEEELLDSSDVSVLRAALEKGVEIHGTLRALRRLLQGPVPA